MKYILKIQNLKKTYSKKTIDFLGKFDVEYNYVLNNLSMQIPQAKVCSIMGGNGSGKTTLFNLIGGYLTPDSGQIVYSSENREIELTNMEPHKIARLGLGRMFQGTHIFKNLTVLENLYLADDNDFDEYPFISLLVPNRSIKKVKAREAKAIEVLQKLFGDRSLFQKKESLGGSLSYGEQRLLAIARLFMNEKINLFLLDEPCAGVNSYFFDILIDAIIELRRNGKTILIIEHNTSFIKELSDYCFYLENGMVASEGSYEKIIDYCNKK